MDTEKARKLLHHFKENGVSHNPDNDGLGYVLEYQDIIGHSSKQEIVDFEESLEKGSEKKNFAWVNFLTLSQDTAIDIIKDTVVSRFIQKETKVLDDMYNKKYQEYNKKSNQLSDAKKHIYKKIRELGNEKKHLVSRVEYLESALEIAYRTNREHDGKRMDAQTKARKYDAIKGLLA